MAPIPEGFVIHTRSSAVTKPWEPIYACANEKSFRLAVVVAEAHCNSRGFLHGGVIAALADNAMGLTLASVAIDAQRIVTTSLSLDYMGSGKIGQWLEIAPRLVAASKSTGIVDAIISADGVVIARANASFRVQRE